MYKFVPYTISSLFSSIGWYPFLPVHLPGHGPQSLILSVRLVSVLEGFRGFHNVIDIDSRFTVQRPPEHTG